MREALEAADQVIVEDTRRSGRLLQQFGLKKPLFALHEHNESDVVPDLIARLSGGSRMALICDAGTPSISDPGFRLVRAAQTAGLRIVPVPGASAVVTALCVSGLPTDRFTFEGFLPAKQAARVTRLNALAAETRTMVFYESVHRIDAMLLDCIGVFGAERMACIGRELTKMHEQIVQDQLAGLQQQVATGRIPLKGEFVVVIGGGEVDADAVTMPAGRLLETLIAAQVPVRQAARIVADASGLSRNALYQAGLALRDPGED